MKRLGAVHHLRRDVDCHDVLEALRQRARDAAEAAAEIERSTPRDAAEHRVREHLREVLAEREEPVQIVNLAARLDVREGVPSCPQVPPLPHLVHANVSACSARSRSLSRPAGNVDVVVGEHLVRGSRSVSAGSPRPARSGAAPRPATTSEFSASP